MNSEILKDYFTDTQIAAIEGITLGGLRNKIYRLSKEKASADPSQSPGLPEFINANPRNRLWHKEKVRAWLMDRYKGDHQTVERLMKVGEDAGKKASTDAPATAA